MANLLVEGCNHFNDFLESAFDYNDYCNRRDKTVLTLNQLKELVCSRI